MNTFTIGPGNNACTVSGQGEPVVLLHGSACSKGQWAGLTHLLETQFQVIAVDLLGHGETPAWPGPEPLTLADEAAVISALVHDVGGPVHLVGHSYGGAVALHFAQAHAEQVRSLVLIEPVAFNLLGMAGPASAALLGGIRWLAGTVRRETSPMSAFVDFWNGPGAWANLSEERQAAIEAKAPIVAAHFAAVLRDPTTAADYQRIIAPTLVMCGTETPAPARCIAEHLPRLLPNVWSQRIAGAGHMLPITHAEAVNQVILAHLQAGGLRRVAAA